MKYQRLKDKVILITGATQGIGLACAELFIEHGAKVIINCKENNDQSELLKHKYKNKDVMVIKADVINTKEVDNMVFECIHHFGKINVLVNNAGINMHYPPLKVTDDLWHKCLEVDLKGAWNCAKAVLPNMIKNKYGDIINIASVHGHKIIPHTFPYPIAKHGLIGMTKALAIEYAADNIRVNSISPGLIMTSIAIDYFNSTNDSEKAKREQENILPNKRIGQPEEVAYTALFLASDEARFINGTDILIDGARSQIYHD